METWLRHNIWRTGRRRWVGANGGEKNEKWGHQQWRSRKRKRLFSPAEHAWSRSPCWSWGVSAGHPVPTCPHTEPVRGDDGHYKEEDGGSGAGQHRLLTSRSVFHFWTKSWSRMSSGRRQSCILKRCRYCDSVSRLSRWIWRCEKRDLTRFSSSSKTSWSTESKKKAHPHTHVLKKWNCDFFFLKKWHEKESLTSLQVRPTTATGAWADWETSNRL